MGNDEFVEFVEAREFYVKIKLRGKGKHTLRLVTNIYTASTLITQLEDAGMLKEASLEEL